MNFLKKFFSHISTLKPFLITMPVTEKVLDPKRTEELLTVLMHARIPFALEVVVENIGNHLKFFIAIPDSAISLAKKTMLPLFKDVILEPNQEASIFGTPHVHEGVYIVREAQSIESEKKNFLTALHQFSKLELVEEGIALQIVCAPDKDPEKLLTTIRLVASASTPLRTKSLIREVLKNFPNWNSVREGDAYFLSQFANRELNLKQAQSITPKEITEIFYL